MTVCQLYEKYIQNRANVRHGTKQGRKQLMRILEEDTIGAYRIETPKTDNGIRKIPMSDRVLEALQRVMQNRKSSNFTVDGYTGFLFLTRNGTPQACINYDSMFRRITEKYNKNHEDALPAVTTPHTLRHTFCTNMANAGMNPKALQYLMGHANITMTLNYYAHATFDSVQAEFFRLAA